jgi:hypothetical protein
MTELIVSLEHIRAKARAAHAAGAGRDDHHMNWHAAALPHWQEEWDRCEENANSRRLANKHLGQIKQAIQHSFRPAQGQAA